MTIALEPLYGPDLLYQKIMGQQELFIILDPPFYVVTGQMQTITRNIVYPKTKIPAWQKDAIIYCLNKISFKSHRNRVNDYQNVLADSYSLINRDRYELKIADYFDVINVGNDPRDFELPNQEWAFINGVIHWHQLSIAVKSIKYQYKTENHEKESALNSSTKTA